MSRITFVSFLPALHAFFTFHYAGRARETLFSLSVPLSISPSLPHFSSSTNTLPQYGAYCRERAQGEEIIHLVTLSLRLERVAEETICRIFTGPGTFLSLSVTRLRMCCHGERERDTHSLKFPALSYQLETREGSSYACPPASSSSLDSWEASGEPQAVGGACEETVASGSCCPVVGE